MCLYLGMTGSGDYVRSIDLVARSAVFQPSSTSKVNNLFVVAGAPESNRGMEGM